jgi:hypothetical protein
MADSGTNIFGGTTGGGSGISSATFGAAGAGVSDIFAGFGAEAKGQGDLLEQQNYLQAEKLANTEAEFTKQSTAIQEMQQSREISKSLGQTTADVAGAGFATSGSAIDLLRESAAQGAITKQVTQQQGNITEQGYKEQAASYANMAAAAGIAAGAESKAATMDFMGAGIQGAAAIGTLNTGSVTSIASSVAGMFA